MSVGKLKSWKVGLSGNAQVTEEQLRDGRKYEDWLKDKVERKKTDGNEGTRSSEEGLGPYSGSWIRASKNVPSETVRRGVRATLEAWI